MKFKDELIWEKERIEDGVKLEQKISTESFFLLVKSRLKAEMLKGYSDIVRIDFKPLNRENYQEMFNLNIDFTYLKELCMAEEIDFYEDYVISEGIKWQTYFFEINMTKEKVLVKAVN